jgi:hypothetical protein
LQHPKHGARAAGAGRLIVDAHVADERAHALRVLVLLLLLLLLLCLQSLMV